MRLAFATLHQLMHRSKSGWWLQSDDLNNLIGVSHNLGRSRQPTTGPLEKTTTMIACRGIPQYVIWRVTRSWSPSHYTKAAAWGVSIPLTEVDATHRFSERKYLVCSILSIIIHRWTPCCYLDCDILSNIKQQDIPSNLLNVAASGSGMFRTWTCHAFTAIVTAGKWMR